MNLVVFFESYQVSHISTLPPSWRLGPLDEGAGAEHEGNPPVPAWALGAQSYPPGQQTHKPVNTTLGSSRRRK